MARETRAQRRAARAEQEGAPPRRPDKPSANGEGGDGRKRAPEPQPVQHRPGFFGRIFRFIGESWAELQKVEWPGQSQVIQATVVVLVACIVVGVYLYANDLLWKHVVQRILNQ